MNCSLAFSLGRHHATSFIFFEIFLVSILAWHFLSGQGKIKNFDYTMHPKIKTTVLVKGVSSRLFLV